MQPNQTEPREIDIEGPTSPLLITWEDGHRSAYELEYLRRVCPCAQCTQHGAVPLSERLARAIHGKAAEVKSIQEVGNYALAIVWGDGHDTGIYSFQYLRESCACPICRPVVDWEV